MIYAVSILNFTVFEEEEVKEAVIEQVCLYRKKAEKPYSKKLNLIFVELPKFNKKPEELKTNTDGWLFLLRNTCNLKSCPPEITRKIFKSFLEEAKVEHLTQTEMETYARTLRKSYEVMDIADCNRKKGRREGRMEGRREGRREGRMEGMMEVASKLLQKNTPIDDVISLTGLTCQQIQELLNLE